jgi:hypothetical protein
VPHTGPVRQPPKLGSTKAAAQVAATILAKRIKVRTRDGLVRLRKNAESYHTLRDAIARVISEEFAGPSTREVLELNFALETHPLLQRAAIRSGINGIVWPSSLAVWMTRRDNIVTVSFHEPSMIEHGVSYSASLVPPPEPAESPRESFADMFARWFAPSRA